MTKTLLLSPYDAMSHQYWREALVGMLSSHQFEVVTLPPRFFSWRFRGNSLTLAHDPRLDQDFDLIIATSMTDLSALRGMLPRLANIPCILYFHENQFAYPSHSHKDHQLERQVTSIYAALSANCLVFNSEFNRNSFLAGVAELLKKLPDGVPKHLPQMLSKKSSVISVPVPAINQARHNTTEGQVQIVWNHRWEYDKGIRSLLHLVEGLLERTQGFQFHLIGQSFRQQPREISQIIDLLSQAGCLGKHGFIESRQAYLQLLSQSQIVLSTAEHEFQGLAILEAMAAGNIPVVPDALAYQEFVPAGFRYQDADDAITMLESHIDQLSNNAEGSSHLGLPEQVDPALIGRQWQSLVSRMIS